MFSCFHSLFYIGVEGHPPVPPALIHAHSRSLDTYPFCCLAPITQWYESGNFVWKWNKIEIHLITLHSTVGINPILSDLNTTQTLELGWRYFEANKNDWNELQIRKNSQKGTGAKKAEKLKFFEKFERKKNKFQPCSQPRDLLMTG